MSSSSSTHTEIEMENFRRELDRLAQMAEALHAFAPKHDMIATPHDLNETIMQRIEKLKPQAREHNLYFRLELDPNGCPSKIHPDRFGPILSDLIKNAIEVSSPGQTIRIGSERGGDFCKIYVSDHGQGIRPEHLPRIFSPFFTTKPTGQGLALAASRKYLRELGGDIAVESEFGSGAIFTLHLPREETATTIKDVSNQT
jgi:signal transduction histidine kinase